MIKKHDAEVQFLHPHGPEISFVWPSREKMCFILYIHILLSISMCLTSSQQQCKISDKDFKMMPSIFSDMSTENRFLRVYFICMFTLFLFSMIQGLHKLSLQL